MSFEFGVDYERKVCIKLNWNASSQRISFESNIPFYHEYHNLDIYNFGRIVLFLFGLEFALAPSFILQ